MGRLIFLLAFFWMSPIFAEGNSSISVTGTGAVRVVPDQVSITVGFVSRDKQAQVAKSKSDTVMRGMIAAVKKLGVLDKDVQSDFAQIDLEGDYHNTSEPKMFVARRSLRILLRNVAQFDSLTAALFEAGANSLSSIDFGHSKESELRARSRVLAVKNARETAETLAKEAGLKLGVAKSISMGSTGRPMYSARSGMASADLAVSSGPSIAQGEIEVTTELSVEFEAK